MNHGRSFGRKRRSGRKNRSAAQKRHQEKASKAMKLFKSGRSKSLKAAWKMVKAGK